MSNYLLTIAYDGSRFHGWQRQPSEVTVQGYLEQTFSRLFDRQISLNGTSRTDAGVHALGQRASFVAELGIPTEKLAMVMNNALCGREEGSFAISPVRILEAKEVPDDFHARFSSRGKRYIYRIRPSLDADIFRRNYVYHVDPVTKDEPQGVGLELEEMKRAAEHLVGTHDFKSFETSGGTPRETTVRTIFDAEIISSDDEVIISVSGDGFLYNMVRIITGTLVEVGQKKRSAREIPEIIEARDRTMAGHTAPPYGLYLKEVFYEDD